MGLDIKQIVGLGSPSKPTPAPAPAPAAASPAQEQAAENLAAQNNKTEEERKKSNAARLIFTGPQGDLSPVQTARVSLLGQ